MLPENLKKSRKIEVLWNFLRADPWERGILGSNFPKNSTKIVKFTSKQGIPAEIPTAPEIPKSTGVGGRNPKNPWIFLRREEENLPEKKKIRILKSLRKSPPATLEAFPRKRIPGTFK